METWNSGGGRDARSGDAGGAGGGGVWMRERGAEAGFALNAILSATCMGPVLAPQAQPYPSTAGFVRQLFEGTDLAVFQWLQPQRSVDAHDAAALHVAALVLEGLEGERVFGWAEPYTWKGVVKVMEKLYPGRDCAAGG